MNTEKQPLFPKNLKPGTKTNREVILSVEGVKIMGLTTLWNMRIWFPPSYYQMHAQEQQAEDSAALCSAKNTC